MKFFPVNPDIDKKMDLLMKKIRHHKNGETSDMMKNSGAGYCQNYGVSLVHLREIAGGMEKDNYFSRLLWYREIRETMIVATLLVDVDKMENEELEQWGEMISNIELSEQLGRNILSNPGINETLLKSWLENERFFMQYAAAMGAGWRFRIYPDAGFDLFESFLPHLKELSGDLRSVRAGSFALRMAGRFSSLHRPFVLSIARGWKVDDNAYLRQVGEDVEYELETLYKK